MTGLWVLAGIFLMFALGFLLICLVVCICARLPRRGDGADCLLVLGAKVRPDGSLSQTLKNRCDAAAGVWRQDKDRLVIACGGRGDDEPMSEAEAMRRYFLAAGLPEEKIVMENLSTNTIENLRNARDLMGARGLRRGAMVTSDYHLTRAMWIARDLGLNVCGVAAKGPSRKMHILKTRITETISWILYFIRKSNGKGRVS